MKVFYFFTLIWGGGTLLAFDYFLQGRFEFFDKLGLYNVENSDATKRHLIKFSKGNGRSTMVFHFVNPACPCYKYNKKYISEIANSTATEGVMHVLLFKEDDPEISGINKKVLSEEEIKATRHFVPSSPAMLVTDTEQGGFVYFGPHSSGAFCGTGEGLLPVILNNIKNGFNPEFINVGVSGCFCSW